MNKDDVLVSLKPYHFRFAWLYSVITAAGIAVLLALEYLLQTEIDAGSGLSIGATLGAAFGVAGKFVNDHGRAPHPAERSRLIWGGIGVLYLVSLAVLSVIFVVLMGRDTYGALLYLVGEVDSVLVIIMAIALGMATAISYGLLYLAYGPRARKLANQLEVSETKLAS